MEKPTNIWKEFSQSKEGEKAFNLIENERATEGAKIIFEEGRLSAFKEMRDYNLVCLEENRLLILTSRKYIKELSDNGSPKEISEQVLLLQEAIIRSRLFTSEAEFAEAKIVKKYLCPKCNMPLEKGETMKFKGIGGIEIEVPIPFCKNCKEAKMKVK
jgi:uncharacterized protein with PIN domain